MAATNAGSTVQEDQTIFWPTNELPKSQGQINDELDTRLGHIENYLESATVPEQGYDQEPKQLCDDPDCGCQDDEGVVGGMYPEPTIEDAINSVIEITQIGITTLKDVALNSENDMAAIEAADSLIGWGQVAAEKIQAIEEGSLLSDLEAILNGVIEEFDAEQGEDADRSSR